jgi:hypothetical protein
VGTYGVEEAALEDLVRRALDAARAQQVKADVVPARIHSVRDSDCSARAHAPWQIREHARHGVVSGQRDLGGEGRCAPDVAHRSTTAITATATSTFTTSDIGVGRKASEAGAVRAPHRACPACGPPPRRRRPSRRSQTTRSSRARACSRCSASARSRAGAPSTPATSAASRARRG